MITGSLGMLPSASIGKKNALYEPVHGSAPDIAGQHKANPIAAIASAAMMLKYTFKMDQAAKLIDDAIEKVLENGFRTEDIYSEGTKVIPTERMTKLIMDEFESLYAEKAINVFTL